MSIICWDGSLKIGVDALDAQHRHLFEIMDHLLERLTTGHAAAALMDGLDSMRTYARFHFDAEERLLELHGYPDREAHRQAHRQFLESLDRLTAQEPTPERAHQALGFLLAWFARHIQTEDGRYAPFLAENGVR